MHSPSSFRRALASRLLVLLATAPPVLAACGADEPERVTRAHCEQLRDHLVELRMASVTADHDQHRAALRASMADFVATCPSSLSLDQVRCQQAARDFPAVAACDPTSSAPATAAATGVTP